MSYIRSRVFKSQLIPLLFILSGFLTSIYSIYWCYQNDLRKEEQYGDFYMEPMVYGFWGVLSVLFMIWLIVVLTKVLGPHRHKFYKQAVNALPEDVRLSDSFRQLDTEFEQRRKIGKNLYKTDNWVVYESNFCGLPAKTQVIPHSEILWCCGNIEHMRRGRTGQHQFKLYFVRIYGLNNTLISIPVKDINGALTLLETLHNEMPWIPISAFSSEKYPQWESNDTGELRAEVKQHYDDYKAGKELPDIYKPSIMSQMSAYYPPAKGKVGKFFQLPAPIGGAPAYDEESGLYVCPYCGELTDSPKQFNLIGRVVFLVFGAVFNKVEVTACPKCMRKQLSAYTFNSNIITAWILWPFLFLPMHGFLYLKTFGKGKRK